MGLLKKLFSVPADNSKPKERPKPDGRDMMIQLLKKQLAEARAPVPPGREIFNFQENLTAGGDTSGPGLHRPAPQTMYVEVVTQGGRVLASDTIELGRDQIAPRGPHTLGIEGEIPCTFVIIGETSRAQQEFTAPLGRVPGLPFPLPEGLLRKDRIGGAFIRAWWSCEEKAI